MGEMFGGGANFKGIADLPLKVSKVIQKAFIEVNEEGCEAAAVTGKNRYCFHFFRACFASFFIPTHCSSA